jgi:hypothetical protein
MKFGILKRGELTQKRIFFGAKAVLVGYFFELCET